MLAWEYLFGKVLLGDSRPQCEGAIRVDYVASDAALSPEIVD
jgi:hypothetical protein